MEKRNEGSAKVEDDVMLPGFRFHPTDEELVGFYLKRKIEHRPLSIELIKQLDIYKYDPWDLPKVASTGEKEWYFYCPRDRKYRNSSRPNRVTQAGFWKATGTDRPIYSAHSPKCIGLKKSLVFYKGRAAKGLKTDWMMHEYRLPSLPHSNLNHISANESWAICKIFKKTNTTQRHVSSHSTSNTRAKSESISNKVDENVLFQSKTSSDMLLSCTVNDTQVQAASIFPCNIGTSYNPFEYLDGKLPQLSIPNETFTPCFTFPPMEALDVSSILLNMSSSEVGDFGSPSAVCLDQLGASPADSIQQPEMQGHTNFNGLLGCPNANFKHACEQWEAVSSIIGHPPSCIWENLFN